ncbi:hypothetical protein NMG60_11031562 [Bertholletia excelsa]
MKPLPFLCFFTLFLAPSLLVLPPPSSIQSCSNFVFSHHKTFASCTDLPSLASSLHWNHDPSSRTLQIAYRHSQISSLSSWVAWGINPTSKGMIGTQALIAYRRPDATMAVFTSPINSYQTKMERGTLSFPVTDLSAIFVDDQIIIFKTMELPTNSSTLYHVWQDGPVSGDSLGMHEISESHLQSVGTLNLTSGQAVSSQSGKSKAVLRAIHGALNTVGWGIMMPLGFMCARYVKAVGSRADPLCFYLHASIQTSAYLIGIAGGATGIILGIKSSGVHHSCHLGIGITLFSLGLLQEVSALFWRPRKESKYRYMWNVFHHVTGYIVLLLSFANIWGGFKILKPEEEWMIAYGAAFRGLILSSLLLEAWKMARGGNIDHGV